MTSGASWSSGSDVEVILVDYAMGNLAGNSTGPKVYRFGAPILSQLSTILMIILGPITTQHSTAINCQFSKKDIPYFCVGAIILQIAVKLSELYINLNDGNF